MCFLLAFLARRHNNISVLPLPVGTGRPRPSLSKKGIDFDHEIMANEKK
jgi:hypothetical protein